MKENQVKEMVLFLQRQISFLILNANLLDDKEKDKMLRNINHLIEINHYNVTELVGEELANEYQQELENAKALLQERGLELSTALNSMAQDNAIRIIVSDTMVDLSAAYRTARINMTKNIEKTIGEVKEEIAKGIMYGDTRKKTTKRVQEAFLKEGMTSFVTSDGKQLPLDFYSETVVRTKTRTARINAHVNTYEGYGVNLVEVVGASDPCPHCGAYHDMVFSTDGKDKRFPHLNVRNVFPLHPNCRCSVIPFVAQLEDEEVVQEKIDLSKEFDPTKDRRTEEQKASYKKMQDARRKARQEVKEYDKIKSILGNDAPKNIGAYRRMKRNKSKGYLEIQRRMRALSS